MRVISRAKERSPPNPETNNPETRFFQKTGFLNSETYSSKLMSDTHIVETGGL